ncbi:MAG: cell division protein FtsZ, partial [Desulfobulbus sp.]
VPNDRLLSLMQKNSTLVDMMQKVDHVLLQAVKGITDLINLPGHINVDFADLRTVMKEVGPAIMGTGAAVGENRASEAAKRAIDNQLLEDVGIDGARGVLVNISATEETLTLAEFMEASALIQEKAHEDANVIIGALFDESCGEELQVTVIATGIDSIDEAETISQIELVKGKAVTKPSPGPSSVQEGEEPARKARKERPVREAKPNKMPTGLSKLPFPVFDDHDLEDYDEPAYLRKKAN